MARESFRAFSPELEALAESWAKTVLTDKVWTDQGFFGSSESNPLKVACGTMVPLLQGVEPGENPVRERFSEFARRMEQELFGTDETS